MRTFLRQGMVKAVRVREYDDQAKFLVVSIKAPTDLPIAQWQSSSAGQARHVDEIDMAVPLNAEVRPGDLVAFEVQITSPLETHRFQGVLEAGAVDEDDDVLDVNVEDGMREEA